MASIAYNTDKKSIERGDIFYVESIYSEEGSEQKSGRPAIVVSNDKGNENAPIISVVYLTTAPKNYLPTHVTIRSSPKISTALCEQVTTVSKSRLGSYMSTCTKAEMEQIGIALEVALGIETGSQKPKEVVREVVVEKPVEVIKEVIVEKPVEIHDAADNSELIKVTAERDTYKQMYQDLLMKLMEK